MIKHDVIKQIHRSLSVQQPPRKWGSSCRAAINMSSGIFMSSNENMVTILHIWYDKCAAAMITRSYTIFKSGSKTVSIERNFKTGPRYFWTIYHTYREMEGIDPGYRCDEYPVPLIIPIGSVYYHSVVDYRMVRW